MLTKSLVSKVVAAGQQLTRMLDVPSILADGTGVPPRSACCEGRETYRRRPLDHDGRDRPKDLVGLRERERL